MRTRGDRQFASCVPDGVETGYFYDLNDGTITQVDGQQNIDEHISEDDTPFQVYWSLDALESEIKMKYYVYDNNGQLVSSSQERANEEWNKLVQAMVKA